MRGKKLIVIVLTMLILTSTINVFAGGTLISGNDTTDIKSNSDGEFTGNINEEIEGTFYVKDDSPSSDKVLALGNGYSIDLDYNTTNSAVTWEIDEPNNSNYSVEIDYINVKAGNNYIKYNDGIDDGSQTLKSVIN